MGNAEFIEGVSIIAKHLKEEQGFDLCAEHDQIWFCEYDIVPEGKDKERLLELGWFFDEDSWSCFA